MKIHDGNPNGAAGVTSGQAPEVWEVDRPGSAPASLTGDLSGGDRAHVSNLAGRISRALSAHTAEHAQRIRDLAQEYGSGRYAADAQSTSRALVNDALEGKDEAR